MPPLRVLYLVRNYGIGGVQTVVQLMLQHLPANEFEILVVPYKTGSEFDRKFHASVAELGVRVGPESIRWRGPRDWWNARKEIRELIDRYQIDIIHTHDDQSNMLVGIGRQRYPCACVASAYGWFENPWNFKLRLFYSIERRWALPNFDLVYTVSNDMRRKIAAGGTALDRVRVIHTGIDATRFTSRGRRRAVRERLGIPQDAIVVGTVSRLSHEKGHRYLLNAASQLMPEHARLILLCVGTGERLGPLRRQAQQLGLTSRICFPGYYEDLAGALEAMDIFALPSILDEGFPTSAVEAQAAGLPVVASDIGGTRETLDVGSSGLLVPPADAKALAQALNRLLHDEALRRRMGVRALQWVQDSFSVSAMTRQLAEMYRQAVSTRTSGATANPGRPPGV